MLVRSRGLGDVYKRQPLEEAMHKYQRPECRHCGDFSAEMADISCGGVGTRLLYTSDAADERSSADLGGRRII